MLLPWGETDPATMMAYSAGTYAEIPRKIAFVKVWPVCCFSSATLAGLVWNTEHARQQICQLWELFPQQKKLLTSHGIAIH